MDEVRMNAAMLELSTLNSSVMQRCLNFAGDLAVAKKLIDENSQALVVSKKENDDLKGRLAAAYDYIAACANEPIRPVIDEDFVKNFADRVSLQVTVADPSVT